MQSVFFCCTVEFLGGVMKKFSSKVELLVYEKAKTSDSYMGGGWARGVFGDAEFLRPTRKGLHTVMINGVERKLSRDMFGLFCTLSAYLSLACNPKHEHIISEIPVLEKTLLTYLGIEKIYTLQRPLNQFNDCA